MISAGTGVFHSEYNNLPDTPVTLLQIWVYPNKKNVKPRYDHQSIDQTKLKNRFHQIYQLIQQMKECGYTKIYGFT